MNSEPAELFRPMTKTASPRRPVYVFPGSRRRPLAALACDDPAPARRVADSHRHGCPFRGALPVPERASATPHHRQRGLRPSGPIDMRCASASSAICHHDRPAGPEPGEAGRRALAVADLHDAGAGERDAHSPHPGSAAPHPDQPCGMPIARAAATACRQCSGSRFVDLRMKPSDHHKSCARSASTYRYRPS